MFIPAMLILLGHLTTPVFGATSLSEHWAYVRYLEAIDHADDLRITRAFSDIDSHLKTILSDDFGVGVSMSWLTERLELLPQFHGRYFIQRLSALWGVEVPKMKKSGPQKSPDFVALDVDGLLHVVECKGTQSGPAYRNAQISGATPAGEPAGAIAQKRVIAPPAMIQGQRLAAGLSIAGRDSVEPSHLLLCDPEPDEKFAFGQDQLPLVSDPVIRAGLAKMLRTAGFRETADLIASPSGPTPAARAIDGRLSRRREDERLNQIRLRRERASAEIVAGLLTRRRMQIGAATFIGREIQVDFSQLVRAGSVVFDRAIVRQGVSQELLQAVGGNALEEGHIVELEPRTKEWVGRLVTKGEGSTARLTIGSEFAVEIILLSGATLPQERWEAR